MSEGIGFAFIYIPMEEMNRIAVNTIINNRRIGNMHWIAYLQIYYLFLYVLAYYTHYFSGHESTNKLLFDRNLFIDQNDSISSFGHSMSLNRTETFEYGHETIERNAGIISGVLYDLEKNIPIQWKFETLCKSGICVRNNYFLENGLTLVIDDFNLSPEMSQILEGPANIIEDSYSILA